MNTQLSFPTRLLIAILPFFTTLCLFFLPACREKNNPPLPAEFQQGGAFVKTLPYYNPDSCVMLIRRDVPKHWQGAAYQNLFLDGPEDSPLELGFRHLDEYEKNFPADSAREFAQQWRGQLYIFQNKFDSAWTCLNQAYESSINHRRLLRASDVQNSIAGLYYQQGKTTQALRALLTARAKPSNSLTTNS